MKVPSWVLEVLLVVLFGIVGVGWTKVDTLREELTIEKTSRIYIERQLQNMAKKLDSIDKNVREIKERPHGIIMGK